MLNPVEAMECPAPPQVDYAFAQTFFRFRARIVTLPKPHNAREVFHCLVRILGNDAPIIATNSMRHGGAFWYRAPNGTGHIVLSASGRMCYQQGILLLIHHLIEMSHPSRVTFCPLFDDARWQTCQEYAQHRSLYAYLMTTRLTSTFRPSD